MYWQIELIDGREVGSLCRQLSIISHSLEVWVSETPIQIMEVQREGFWPTRMSTVTPRSFFLSGNGSRPVKTCEHREGSYDLVPPIPSYHGVQSEI